MTDFSATIVTYIDSDTPFNWGLELERIHIPMVVFTSPSYEQKLKEHTNFNVVSSIYFTQSFQNSTLEKILLLDNVCKTNPFNTTHIYWLDPEYLQSTLSFEFLYSTLLEKWLSLRSKDFQMFYHDGHRHDIFFGGTLDKLSQLMKLWQELTIPLFIPAKNEMENNNELKPNFFEFTNGGANVQIAEVVDEPVLHIIGDSHSLFSLTPLKTIGARNHIFFNTKDGSSINIPFNYQFTHHLGSYSMYSFTEGRIVKEDVLAQFKIKAGDFLFFSFGEIDVRCHLCKQVRDKGISLKEVVSTLASDYISYICELREISGTEVGVFGVIPPFNPSSYGAEHKPIVGTLEERIEAVTLLNQELKDKAKQWGIFYVDVNLIYATERGDLQPEISDSFCHISHYHKQPGLDHFYFNLNNFLTGKTE